MPCDIPPVRRMLNRMNPSAVPVPVFPEDVQIQTVSGCNARCTFCPNGNGSSKLPSGRMSDELYQRIVDECLENPIKRISPYLMNEPLLDNTIGEKISYIAARKPAGVSIKINTNGALLKGDIAQSIADSGLDRLNVSFHGISIYTYETAMQGLSFETALENIETFISLLRQQSRRTPRVTIVAIETTLNSSEILQLKRYWNDRGISVHVRRLENRSNNQITGKGLAQKKMEPVYLV